MRETLVYASVCVCESVGQAAEMCIGKVHKFKHVKHESESLPAYLKCCPWPVCIVRGCRATERESNIKRRACQKRPYKRNTRGMLFLLLLALCCCLLLSLMYLHNFMSELQLAAQAFKWQCRYIWPQCV